MIVLAIDTAGPVIGVALGDGDGNCAERTSRIVRGADELLPALIDQVRAEYGIPLGGVAGIGVSAGPGAFTGLRVGLATAAGLAFALDVPVWTASSVLPRAHAAGLDGELLVALDARKGRLYAAAWRDQTQIHPVGDVEPAVAFSWLNRPFRATGEGALAYRAQIEAAGGVVIPDPDQPGTSHLVRLTCQGLARGEGVDARELRAEYVRDADAVIRSAGITR